MFMFFLYFVKKLSFNWIKCFNIIRDHAVRHLLKFLSSLYRILICYLIVCKSMISKMHADTQTHLWFWQQQVISLTKTLKTHNWISSVWCGLFGNCALSAAGNKMRQFDYSEQQKPGVKQGRTIGLRNLWLSSSFLKYANILSDIVQQFQPQLMLWLCTISLSYGLNSGRNVLY